MRLRMKFEKTSTVFHVISRLLCKAPICIRLMYIICLQVSSDRYSLKERHKHRFIVPRLFFIFLSISSFLTYLKSLFFFFFFLFSAHSDHLSLSGRSGRILIENLGPPPIVVRTSYVPGPGAPSSAFIPCLLFRDTAMSFLPLFVMTS